MFFVGCATKPSARTVEWQPGVIAPSKVVLMPVRNLSANSDAVEFVERTVPVILRDKGYQIVSNENAKISIANAGISSVDEVWKTPVGKLGPIVGADGMMFVSIEYWQKNYELLDTDAKVILLYVLYNKSGKKLWSWKQEVYKRPGTGYADSTGNIVADVLIGVVGGALSHSLTDMESLAAEANDLALNSGKNPLPNYR
jgi:hypothetical protein